MVKTNYHIEGENFFINGKMTYSEEMECDPKIRGLLFNCRFIQGIFEDKNPANRGRYDRFGKVFDAEQNTDSFIDCLDEWYEAGIRAITVGLQGGGSIYTYQDWSVIDTGCFSKDGKSMDEGWAKRLKKLIAACDERGMLVIVSLLYQAQIHLMEDGVAAVRAIRTACEYLNSLEFDNVIIEVANEHDVGDFVNHPIIGSGEGMGTLIGLAREWSGGRFAVGASGGGGSIKKEIADQSDVVLIHGNGLRRQELYDFIGRVRAMAPGKPIVCNEDSQMFGQLAVARATHTSWGYYNNMTKQEPPADWSVTRGEDEYFARRLRDLIKGKKEAAENEFYLQGFEADSHIDGRRYIKLASLYPERINYVEFYEDEKLLYTSFDEPFMLYSLTTWEQAPYYIPEGKSCFSAKIYLADGSVKTQKVQLNLASV